MRERNPRTDLWSDEELAAVLEAHKRDLPGRYEHAYAACPTRNEQAVYRKLTRERAKQKAKTRPARDRSSRLIVGGGPVVAQGSHSFLDSECEYDPSLPAQDTHALMARIAMGIKPKRKARTAEVMVCYYCGVVGQIAPVTQKIYTTRLQPIEGLEEHNECVQVRNCEARILKNQRAA